MGVLFFGGTIGWNILSRQGKANITESATTPPVTTPVITPDQNTNTVETPIVANTSDTNTGETNTGETLTESGTTDTGTTLPETGTGSSSSGTTTQTEGVIPPVTSSTMITDSGLEYRVTENTKVNIRRPRNPSNLPIE